MMALRIRPARARGLWLHRLTSRPSSLRHASTTTASSDPQTPAPPSQGSLGRNSIFAAHRPVNAQQQQQPTEDKSESITEESHDGSTFRWGALSATLDPAPLARRRWERKMTIRAVRSRGVVPRAVVIKRNERQHVSKSDLLRTSTKKLQPLATQIAGKTIDEAILQMRFSRKKVARDVLEHLEKARDGAVVQRGMGLGQPVGERRIRLKDGTRRIVRNTSEIYVEQAWVGKGTYGKRAWARARGRIDVQRLPQTSLTVLLKEEKTRVREHAERVVKERRRKVWTQHKDRPIYGQRQYYSW